MYEVVDKPNHGMDLLYFRDQWFSDAVCFSNERRSCHKGHHFLSRLIVKYYFHLCLRAQFRAPGSVVDLRKVCEQYPMVKLQITKGLGWDEVRSVSSEGSTQCNFTVSYCF